MQFVSINGFNSGHPEINSGVLGSVLGPLLFFLYLIFFFYQNDLHVLLTKQFYKINCEIIKIKINREKEFNKTMTKHIQNLINIFWMLRQWLKSRIK